jgi:hypothetical protein
MLAAFEAAGGVLVLRGEQIKARYPDDRREVLAPILAQLRAHREEVVQFLREQVPADKIAESRYGLTSKSCARETEPAWPAASLESQRKFGHPLARLYPFLGKKVRTPAGVGELLQVISGRVAVLLDAESATSQTERRMSFFSPEDICPTSLM